MASAWIAEHVNLPVQQGALAPVVRLDGTNKKKDYTSSTQSDAFATGTRFITINADAVVHLEFGLNPTATVNSWRLPANTVITVEVVSGEKVALFDGSS